MRLIDVDICIEKIKNLSIEYDAETVQRCIEAVSNAPTIDTPTVDNEDFPEGFFEKPRRHATEEKDFDEKTCIPVTITPYGWICPKCGRTLSPYTAVCPCCDKWEVTC